MKTKTLALPVSLLLAIGLFVSAFSGTAFAQSEGFETLMLNGNRIGDAVIVSPNYFGINPTEGTHALLLTTISANDPTFTPQSGPGMNAVSLAQIASFLGVTDTQIRNKKMTPPQATGQEGSAFELDLGFIDAGMVITFDYNFLTADPQSRDFAFYTLTGLVGETFTFADTTDVNTFTGGGNPFNLQIGTFQTVTIPITTAGNYVLGIGIMDGTTFVNPSALLVDNIVVAVPEPSTVGLGIAGAILLGALRRRAKKNS